MEDLLTKTKSDIKIPRKYHVVMLNDDYTPMELVIHILITIFNKTMDDAVSLTYEIHENGQGIAGTYALDIAETKQALAMDKAKEHEVPFRLELKEA